MPYQTIITQKNPINRLLDRKQRIVSDLLNILIERQKCPIGELLDKYPRVIKIYTRFIKYAT